MSEYLFHYQRIHPTTWVYLSSLLMIGLYFKFGRFWSVRNLDLLMLILLAPGLLLVHFGLESQHEEQRRAAAMSAMQLHLPLPLEESPPPPSEEADADDPSDAEQAERLPVAADARPEVVSPAQQLTLYGFIWLFVAGVVWLVRLLADTTMVRRPLLEPNLSVGGLTFLGCSLLVFLMANVVTSVPTEDDLWGPREAEQMIAGRDDTEDTQAMLTRHGPGLKLLHLLPTVPTMRLVDRQGELSPQQREQTAYVATAKTMAILSHLAVVLGIVLIGYRHFENVQAGIGAATLYLMLPYTAHMTGRVIHVLPAALLVWAILCYRRPLLAGWLIGLLVGVIYYPLFLLPLWVGFYWSKGMWRFLAGVMSMLALIVLFVVITTTDPWPQVRAMFGLWQPKMDQLIGLWDLGAGGWDPVYRIPVLAAFLALSIGLALWPPQKNLGTLLSCTAAIMVGTQFWHGLGGGTFMAWYLPPLLLTIFRPNLEDRAAITAVADPWRLPRRRAAT